MSAAVTEHDVTLRSGAVAHYVASGPEDGPPVVLLHGGLPGSSGWAGWRFMLPALGAAGFRVYAPDRPGFGQADSRPEHWPVRGFLSWSDFVRDFTDGLGLDVFQLAGNSQGTQTGAYFASRYPERVERMVMVACGGLNPVLDIPSELLTPGVPFPQWDGTEESMRAMLTTIVYRTEALTEDLIARRNEAALLQRQSFDAAAAWNRRALVEPNLRQAHRLSGHLDELTIPMLYLYGRQDVLGPVENAYLQEDRLPNVQFLYPDECGHQGQTDQPEMFNAVFIEFFSTGSLTPTTAAWAGISERRPVLPWVVR
jgi:pimeloyl-ACP methyl ester carboxylesterase